MTEYKLLTSDGSAKRAQYNTVHGTTQSPIPNTYLFLYFKIKKLILISFN